MAVSISQTNGLCWEVCTATMIRLAAQRASASRPPQLLLSGSNWPHAQGEGAQPAELPGRAGLDARTGLLLMLCAGRAWI